MTNFAVVFVIAAFICATNVHVYADDGDNDDNGVSSVFGGNGDPISFPPINMPKLSFPPVKPPNPLDIINLKPKDGNSKVSGTYSSFSSNTETKNGHIVNQSAEAKHIDNKNGKVTEEDSSN